MSTKLLLCDGDWTASATGWECSGAVSQVVYSAPVEYTQEMALEAFFYGFTMFLPVLAIVFGGRQILHFLR